MDKTLLTIIKEILTLLDTQEGFAEMLSDADLPGLQDINTFEENGVLSGNLGLVLSFNDGREYQLTLVRSKWPREEEA